MAIIIHIAYEESDEAVARVRELLNSLSRRDFIWGGADFVIKRDEHTWIKGNYWPARSEEDAVILMNNVFGALDGGDCRHLCGDEAAEA